MSIEEYNKPGLRDAYNVLKHLEDIKINPLETRKGGMHMDTDRVVNQEVPNPETTDDDLFEDDDEDEDE